MNLAELFPDDDYRFQMGLERGNAEHFFGNSTAHRTLEERRFWLRDATERYCIALPECGPLLEETVAVARNWIEPQAFGQGLPPEPARERCLALGQLLEPDFLLLQAEPSGVFRLLGGCVCFPSSWSLAEKIGQPLDFIHGVVPGLNPALGNKIHTFLTRIAPGPAWLRHNWGLSASPELNQHPHRRLPRLDATVEPDGVWLRVEHQALIALPKSQGILFGIRISVHPLSEIKENAVAVKNLIRALRTMPDEVAAYKGILPARNAIIKLLEM